VHARKSANVIDRGDPNFRNSTGIHFLSRGIVVQNKKTGAARPCKFFIA